MTTTTHEIPYFFRWALNKLPKYDSLDDCPRTGGKRICNDTYFNSIRLEADGSYTVFSGMPSGVAIKAGKIEIVNQGRFLVSVNQRGYRPGYYHNTWINEVDYTVIVEN